MRHTQNYRRLNTLAFLLLIMGIIFGLHQTAVTAAQGVSATAIFTLTPIPVSSLNPTLTPLAVASDIRTETRSATPTHTRTPFPTVTPTETATATALVKSQSTVVSTGPLLAQEITLASLGRPNLDFLSPESSQQFTFQLPNNWQPESNNFLNLNVEYFNANTSITTTQASLNAVLQVRFDNELAVSTTFSANSSGVRNVVVPLRIGLLGILARRTHTIQITFDARNLCLVNLDGRVLIRSDLSFFHFEYHEGSPARDLANYPLPFFTQPIGSLVDTALIVIPAQYSASDLQAAAALSAELGQLTGNKLQLRVTTASTITDQDQQNFNLIALGQIGKNTFIDDLYNSQSLPTVRRTDGSLIVNKTAIADTDGVVQIIANPKNPLRSIMVLTSKTEAGLAKAVSAMSGPPSVLKLGGAVALISDIHAAPVLSATIHPTFATLGYQDFTLTGLGASAAEIHFVIPAGTTVSDGAALTLQYDLSDTLLAAQTVLTVTMNDTQIDSIPLGLNNAATPATTAASGTRQVHVSIPPNTVKAGITNILTLQLDVQADWHCNPPDQAATWMLVHATSDIYLPNHKSDLVAPASSLSLIPAPFSTTADLSDTLISLPDSPDPTDLEQMVRMASYLGSETSIGGYYTPRVILGALPKDIDLTQFHFIVIGRPTTNAFLSQLNDANKLPQPFMPQSDELKQILDNAVFRLPSTYSIGVLEALPSPWSSTHVILVISGTNSAGQALAAGVLLDGKYGPSDLTGNVVFINTSNISIVDTTTGQLPLVSVTPVVSASAINQPTSALAPSAAATIVATPTIPVYTVTPYPSSTPAPTDIAW